MITVKYEKGFNLGYVWPNPPKKPKQFHISLHWAGRCSVKKWWGKLSGKNAFGQRSRGCHSDFLDHGNLCKSLFILKGLEIIVEDDGIEYLCKLTEVYRHAIAKCIVIAKAKIIEEIGVAQNEK